jgi:hypothetical protein
MSWLEHHKVSERQAQLAEVALREGDLRVAQEYYLLAAEAELLVLRSLDPAKQRTLGTRAASSDAAGDLGAAVVGGGCGELGRVC